MRKLLLTFFEIALWRKGPQDLPASTALASCMLVVYAVTKFAGVRLFNLDPGEALVFIGVDVLMLGSWLWIVLTFFDRRQRYVQTLMAAFGVGVILASLDILMRSLQLGLGLNDAMAIDWVLARLLLLALMMGRIFMHALDRGLFTGIALTIAITYSTDAITLLMLDRLGRAS